MYKKDTSTKNKSKVKNDVSSKGDKYLSKGKDVLRQESSIWSALGSVLVVIASALIIFAAARNSITWHAQRFWGASGDFWQAQWDKLLDTVGEDPFALWCYGTIIISLGMYWFLGAIYLFFDITNKPEILRQYKIQPGTNEPVDPKKLMSAIRQVLFNQFIVQVPLSLGTHRIMSLRGFPPVRELPTFHWVVFELAVFLIVEEIAFYYSHRLLHHRYFYKIIHKKHHEWTAPVAITAIYCHPIEHVVANLTPVVLGIIIMGSHVATAYLWFILAILWTQNQHSGYHLPFLPSSEAHDFHHFKFNNCFGVLGILDRIHGTDVQFRASRAYDRDYVLLNLTPAREAYPDFYKSQEKSKKN